MILFFSPFHLFYCKMKQTQVLFSLPVSAAGLIVVPFSFSRAAAGVIMAPLNQKNVVKHSHLPKV